MLDRETALAVLTAFLKERIKLEVRVKNVTPVGFELTCGNLTLVYDSGEVTITAGTGWLRSQLRILTEAAAKNLRDAALLKLKIRVGTLIKAKGGKVLSMQQAKGGTLLKVEL
jgi:hypothetical protein